MIFEFFFWKFGTPYGFQLPKWESTWECVGSFPHIPGNANVTPRLHARPAPFHAFALVAIPRLGSWHSQNKMSGSKLYPFGSTSCMSENMYFVWREGVVLEIAFPSLVFLKRCVRNLNILLDIFTYIFLVFLFL